MKKIIMLLEMNGFENTQEGYYQNSKCVIIFSEQYGLRINGNEGNSITTKHFSIYTIIGMLTYNKWMSKDYFGYDE